MKRNWACPYCNSKDVIRKGRYWRQCDSRWAQKFRCKNCIKNFSEQTSKDTYRHRKTRLVHELHRFLVSAVSQRQMARKLSTTRKTVVRKINLLAHRSIVSHFAFVRSRALSIKQITFDEMETSERTKCLPLSLPLVVSPERYVLAMSVARIPAKGRLAKISRKKYGYRPNEAAFVIPDLFGKLSKLLPCVEKVKSDDKPYYRPLVRTYFPKARHETVEGGQSCIAGQGELKQKGFDPIFELNHTAAMFRDHVANLRRKTWTNTKLAERLIPLLAIYACEHNRNIALKRKEQPPPSVFNSLRRCIKNSKKLIQA